MKKIVAFSKKLINIVSKFDWIVDIDVSLHIIDQLWFFNEFLKSIKRRTIKIEEKKLYSNKYDTTIIKIKNDECRLTKILYVSNLDVNLLFERRLIKKEFKNNFDNDDLYMCNLQDIKVVKASTRDGIYVINHIAFKLFDEFILIVTIVMITNKSYKLTQIILSILFVIIDFDEIFEIITSKKRDLYTF